MLNLLNNLIPAACGGCTRGVYRQCADRQAASGFGGGVSSCPRFERRATHKDSSQDMWVATSVRRLLCPGK